MKKLWHSHAYEIKSGLWVNPRIPEAVVLPELANLAKSYGKFWCTWQTDRGDKLPLGPPSLKMSPQDVNSGNVRAEPLKKREDKYGISTQALKAARTKIPMEQIHSQEDYWKHHAKAFKLDIEPSKIKKIAPFP